MLRKERSFNDEVPYLKGLEITFPGSLLTRPEQDLIRAMIQGDDGKTLARRFNTSVSTVRNAVQKIKDKVEEAERPGVPRPTTQVGLVFSLMLLGEVRVSLGQTDILTDLARVILEMRDKSIEIKVTEKIEP